VSPKATGVRVKTAKLIRVCYSIKTQDLRDERESEQPLAAAREAAALCYTKNRPL